MLFIIDNLSFGRDVSAASIIYLEHDARITCRHGYQGNCRSLENRQQTDTVVGRDFVADKRIRKATARITMPPSTEKMVDSLFLSLGPSLSSPEDDHDSSRCSRQTPWTSSDTQYHQVPPGDQDNEISENSPGCTRQALELNHVPQQTASLVTIKNVPSASKGYLSVPDSANSTKSIDTFNQASTAQQTRYTEPGLARSSTPQSSQCSLEEVGYQHTPSQVDLLAHGGVEGCPTQGDLLRIRWTGLTKLIVFFSIYSTVLSGIFLGIAIARPRWGHRIGTHGAVSYDTATLLNAIIPKSVELTFATTFVAALGQILTRRAFAKSTSTGSHRGISLADASMRLWIMQPGTLFTHWDGAKYAMRTLIGISALVAAIGSAFYTTAAESLVSPKLGFGRNQTLTLFGEVRTSYANVKYLSEACQTPITPAMDSLDAGLTCLQIDFAGNGFRNLDSWLLTWNNKQKPGGTTEESAARPPPVALLYENTTVRGEWVALAGEDMTADSEKHGRLFQNVSMVMPHGGVFHAARSSRNAILQPEDIGGAGEYHLQAVVPAPGLNILCVGTSSEELLPLMQENKTSKAAQWPPNAGGLEGFFGWWDLNLTQGTGAPWFDKLPQEYNTIVNDGYNTSEYGPEWIYMLAKPPNTTITSEYVLCGIRSFQYLDCSTSYHGAQPGGQLSVHCGADGAHGKTYWDLVKDGSKVPLLSSVAKDWRYVGEEWIRAVALTQGISDANAASSRLMTQLIPAWSNGTGANLSPSLPTIGEALGVLAAHTILASSEAAPFVPYSNYTPEESERLSEAPDIKEFEALLSYKDYASRGDRSWKSIFYVILVAVFLQNCFCLVYLWWHFHYYGEVTDYTEPQNLFALAINSPPSHILAGACGGGPSSEMLAKKWCIDMSRPIPSVSRPDEHNGHSQHASNTNRQSTGITHPHFFVRYPEEDNNVQSCSNAQSSHTGPLSAPPSSKHASWTSKFEDTMRRRSRMPRTKSIQNLVVDESPAVAQYMSLIGKQ